MERQRSTEPPATIDELAKVINNHPYPGLPLRPLLLSELLPHLQPPSPSLLYSLFSRLFSAHSLPHKSLELFRFSLLHSPSSLASPSLCLLLSTLSRSPRRLLFPSSAFILLDIARRALPSLLSPATLSALLSPIARRSPDPFPSTLEAFHRAEGVWPAPFGAPELTALLRAFCASRRLADARAAFGLLHSRLPPDSRALNTLLLGFRQAGHLPSLDLFFHELVLRGFRPDAVSYNIRIDAYCKKNRFFEAAQLVAEMEGRDITPTVRTMTTLIHGAGIAGEPSVAWQLFDEMSQRGLSPDRGAYNALMSAVARGGDMKTALKLLDEMELKGIEVDDVSYYTMLCGYRILRDFKGFLRAYRRMIDKGFVPRTRTVMLLMKLFCEKGRLDLGLELWNYLLGKGCCPHRHALDALAKGLCCRGGVAVVYECFKQVMQRGRLPSEKGIQMLEEFLVKAQDRERLKGFREMMSRLKALVPTAS